MSFFGIPVSECSDLSIRNSADVLHVFAGDFDGTVQQKAWDRIKVVCTQPLRKDVQFGLSVLRVVGEEQVQGMDAIPPQVCSSQDRISLICCNTRVLNVADIKAAVKGPKRIAKIFGKVC